MKYHDSKDAALRAGAAYQAGLTVDMQNAFDMRATFEPGNGWVCVLRPVAKEAFHVALALLLDRFDIDLSAWAMRHLRTVPPYHKRLADVQPASGKKAAEEVVEAQWRPGDAKPW